MQQCTPCVRGMLCGLLRQRSPCPRQASKPAGSTQQLAQHAVAPRAPGAFHSVPLQMFVSSLRGMGLHCKAVCSFQPKQLKASFDGCGDLLAIPIPVGGCGDLLATPPQARALLPNL